MKKPTDVHTPKERKTRESAQYITDMLLELRNISKQCGFATLLDLLEISYCEAFSIANKVEVPSGEAQKLEQFALSAQRLLK